MRARGITSGCRPQNESKTSSTVQSGGSPADLKILLVVDESSLFCQPLLLDRQMFLLIDPALMNTEIVIKRLQFETAKHNLLELTEEAPGAALQLAPS